MAICSGLRKQSISILSTGAVLLTKAALATPLDPVSCLIEPYQTVELSTPVAGILAEVAVDRGDLVAAGQVVARLDSRVEALQRDLDVRTTKNAQGDLRVFRNMVGDNGFEPLTSSM